jgi:hypothetical protein
MLVDPHCCRVTQINDPVLTFLAVPDEEFASIQIQLIYL